MKLYFLGGLITGANQLREKYLLLLYEIELQILKNNVISKTLYYN